MRGYSTLLPTHVLCPHQSQVLTHRRHLESIPFVSYTFICIAFTKTFHSSCVPPEFSKENSFCSKQLFKKKISKQTLIWRLEIVMIIALLSVDTWPVNCHLFILVCNRCRLNRPSPSTLNFNHKPLSLNYIIITNPWLSSNKMSHHCFYFTSQKTDNNNKICKP